MNADSTVPSTILRNIFVQLLCNAKTEWVTKFEDLSSAKKARKNPPIDIKVLVDLIQRASTLQVHPRVIIALDALDECQHTSTEFGAFLNSLMLLRKQGLSLFVTSRDEHPFHRAFDSLPSISLNGTNTSLDMVKFVHKQLEGHHVFCTWQDNRREAIEHIIINRAEGM